MRWCEIEKLIETSTAGSSNAGSVASLPVRKSSKGAIGCGFNPNGNYGVYPSPKKRIKLNSPSVIRRTDRNFT